jgi:hypothetical protein
MVNISRATRELGVQIERDKLLQEYRAKKSNLRPHIFSMSVEGFKAKIYQGISAQRRKNLRISAKQDEAISAAVELYASKLYDIFKSGKSSTGKFDYRIIGGSRKDFKVRITGEGNVFGVLKRVRENAGLRRVSNIVKNTFRDLGRDNISFDLSHMEGSTIADQFASEVLAKYESSGFAPQDPQAYEKLKTTIRYNPASPKVAEIEVEDTFWFLNQSTSEEAYVTGLLKKAVGDWTQKNIEGFAQGKILYSVRQIAKTAKKAGVKVSNVPEEPKKSTKTATRTIKYKKPRPATFSIEQLTDRVEVLGIDSPGRPRTEQWSLLIPQINKLLANKVREFMVAPRLVNRTGTFASSVEVTGITSTNGGYPLFSANYQREPYGVFARGAPNGWNTPQRDPKALIEKSVRSVMRNLAKGRFFVTVPKGGI